MDTLEPYVYGERPQRAAAAVVATATVSAVAIAAAGLLGVTGRPVVVLFVLVYGALPVVAGMVCGLGRLGYPAAAVGGLSTGAAFYVVVAAGGALDVGLFGGEDDPLLTFSAALASAGFVWATAGFAVGVAAAVSRD